MRLNLKLLLWLFLIGSLCLSVTFWSRCPTAETKAVLDSSPSNPEESPNDLDPDKKFIRSRLTEFNPGDGEPINYEEIKCVINEEYTVVCRREGSEVYMPFSFIGEYFEVYGKMTEADGVERFDFKQSYSRIYKPTSKYTPQGIFMSFEHYNVEVRDRVKCISGIEGVPISTQWGPEGYFYPIQIAQYGLSHYSKYLSDTERVKVMVEDAEDGGSTKWRSSSQVTVENVYNAAKDTNLIEFEAPESFSSDGAVLKVGSSGNFFISFDFKFINNGSITVTLEPKGKQPQPTYYLHYVCSNTLILVEGYHIYYGIGDHRSWGRIYRDLNTDLMKGLKLKKKVKVKGSSIHKIVSIVFRGHGMVDNVTLSNNAHLAQFYYAANWLVLNQDEQGGWPIMVTRSLANGALKLPPGWYSAMAQGQAMSLLIRAYIRTSNRKYLDCALRATHLFDIPSAKGGVLAKFMGRYDWFEEYPTTPSCYVLNGFIYSLIGLYDLKTIAPEEERTEANQLYSAGLESLKALLPLFDTGSGSIYDLRHFTLGVAPNLARWDYHATHINQLLLLATIESDPVYERTAQRWIGYMKGKRAPHN